MNEQPPLKTPNSWEELTSRLLKLYAKSLIELYDKGTSAVMETAEASNFRKDIRAKIIEVGKTLDETDKQYRNLLDEYQTQQDR